MCKCAEEMKQKIFDKFGYDGHIVNQDRLSRATYSKFEYEEKSKNGTMKKKKINLLHSHCPFCGSEYKIKQS